MKPKAQQSSLTLDDEGRWLVTTTSNRWIFDLDLRRVSILDDADREWAAGGDPRLWLAGIDDLTIGEPAWWWLVRPDDGLHGQLFWIISTTVTSIVRVSEKGLSAHPLGPSYSEPELLERLGVSSQELKALITNGQVLQVLDEQDAPVFPAFQVLEDNRLLPALDAVLGELADSGIDDGRVFWSWLLSRPMYTGGRSLWELLRDGEERTVIHAAGRAAWAWRG